MPSSDPPVAHVFREVRENKIYNLRLFSMIDKYVYCSSRFERRNRQTTVPSYIYLSSRQANRKNPFWESA